MFCPNLGFQSTNSSPTDLLICSVVYLFGLASLNYPKSLAISGNTIQGKLHMNSPALLFHISKYEYIVSWRLFNLKRTFGIVARRKRFGLMATNSVHNIHTGNCWAWSSELPYVKLLSVLARHLSAAVHRWQWVLSWVKVETITTHVIMQHPRVHHVRFLAMYQHPLWHSHPSRSLGALHLGIKS